ncbi:hypothetical protein WJX72_001643 [[Myrmecia] bisecta]|uniref:Uncharacterized protein n=1 Tax=[Myrmecia] bisecta TaxID=41462 RepID=A0AAW1QE98_9CHLO
MAGQDSLSPLRAPPKIKINKAIESVKESSDAFAVSPSTPLLSTAIDENGWVCGKNDLGQLGVGGTADVHEPQVLQVVRRWAALSFGDSHAAGVSGDGEAYTWGKNDMGQIGSAAGEAKDVPTKMDILRGWDVRAIACGAEHTVAITAEDVISWGSNAEGQCGQGERAETTWVKPRSIKPLQGLFVQQVVCGRFHTLCVTATSQVFAWGNNLSGQLGLGDTQNRRAPTLVDTLWAFPVQQLAAGDSHSAALTSSGFLFTWGSNEKGQLGLPLMTDVASTAQRTASERRRAKRKVNQRFLTAMMDMGIPSDKAELALYETGNVGVEVATEWLFSVPEHVLEKHLASDPNTPTSEAEHPEDTRVLAPRRVPLLAVRWVAAGSQHTVAVTDTSVWAWGSNSCGQLGTRTFRDKHSPTEVKDLEGKGVTSVACGTEHTLFLCKDGHVYGCGSTAYGQLPYLKYACGPGVSEASESEDSPRTEGAKARERNEITTPTRLKLPFLQQQRGAKAPVVSAIIAGGYSSAFLTRAPDEFPETKTPQLWERLQTAINNAAAEQALVAASVREPRLGPSAKHLKPIVTAVEMVFASAAALSAAFGLKDKVGIDAALLDSMQRAILDLYKVEAPRSTPPTNMDTIQDSINGLCSVSIQSALYKAAGQLLDDLHRNVRLLGTPERAQVLLAAAQSPLLGEKKLASVLIPRLCNTILMAPSSSRHHLVKWWAEYPAELLEARVVKPLQQYLTDELFVTKKLTVSVMNVIKVLAKVEEANQLGRQLQPDAFYNELISEKLDVEDHYVAWRQTHDTPQHQFGSDGPFSFCSYPFLLSPRAKSKLLHTEARFLMTQTVHQARIEHVHGNFRQRRSLEERVLPNQKTPIKGKSPLSREGDEEASRDRKDVRRRERQHGLRSLWHNMWRNNGEGSGDELSMDQRQMVARELSGTRPHPHHTSPKSPEASTSVAAGTSLQRQGSMNLPKPEESGVPATHPDMCILRIRRNHLLEDALDEIARQKPRDLFKPLRVHFIGEDGIDAGGVKKEFFQLLITELLCPDYGMLIFQSESRTYWFNPSTLEAEDEFMLIGLVLGLAIYNAVLLDFPLPLVLYKKLIGQQVLLRDLEDMEPTLGKSLRQLLQYEGEGSVEDVFCQNFTAGVPGIGETLTVTLKEDGEDMMVTEENRREYVDLYVDYYLNKSVHKQFEAFARGFMMLCGGPAIHLFSATELERLVCGNPILDFDALQNNARYDGGYTHDHRAVKWLWEIVKEFDDEEKRRFLKFFTGSDRSPIGGLGNLRCIVQRDGTDSNKLPTSHTCFNTLLLPSYKSREKMADRLKLAIMNAEGFGLE